VLLSKLYQRLLLVVDLSGRPQGDHSVHFHAVGKCKGPDFKSAGTELTPVGQRHDRSKPQINLASPLPKFTVDRSGNAFTQLSLDNIPVQSATHIFDADGTSIVVDASGDDRQTRPAGKRSAPTACGVLRRP
jgi:Cu-Zn family superoxide dismutase